jgi:hypothetical protein
VRRADNLTTFVCRLSWNQGAWKHVQGLLYRYLHLFTKGVQYTRFQNIRFSWEVVYECFWGTYYFRIHGGLPWRWKFFENFSTITSHRTTQRHNLHDSKRFLQKAPTNNDGNLCVRCSATINKTNTRTVGRDSAVSVPTRYGLDGPGIDSLWGRDFPQPSRPALCPTQPAIRWVPGLSRGYSGRGVALTTHLHLAQRLKKE